MPPYVIYMYTLLHIAQYMSTLYRKKNKYIDFHEFYTAISIFNLK